MMDKDIYIKPWWMWIIIFVFGGISFLNNFILGIISVIIAFACGNKCVDWAIKIKKNKNWAFFIGYMFGLIGLFGYWIFNKNNIGDNKW